MIVVCPTCATRHDVPQSHFDLDGSLIRCTRCGHSWIESRAVSVVETAAGFAEVSQQAVARSSLEDRVAERAVMRLAQAARAAEAKLTAARRKQRENVKGWSLLALCAIMPIAAASVRPETTMSIFPPAARLFAMAGVEVNLRGLEFRNVGQQHRVVDGVRVLAIQGEIVNTSGSERRIPTLAFSLRDAQQRPVYDWELNSTMRPIQPGEASSFVTRLASPPESARDVEIRFARHSVSGSNAGHDSGKN